MELDKIQNNNILVCLKDDLIIADLNNISKLNLSLKKKIELNNIKFLLKIKKNDFLICYENYAIIYANLLSDVLTYHMKIIDVKSIKSGIRLNSNFSALKVCNFASRENNGIYFYSNTINKVIQKKIIGKHYSFIYTMNGLTVIPSEEIESENKILLCACKKYLKCQKNGILFINIKFIVNNIHGININSHFYETGNYEVYCFCPLFKIKEKKIINNEIIKEKTDFFLVGGFDQNKKLGIIKLYKIIYESKFFNNRIEYIQDIIIEKNELTKKENKNYFEGFKGPISCIIQDQSNEKGNILITCWDGNVYILKLLNLDQYLEFDKQIKNNISFNKFF